MGSQVSDRIMISPCSIEYGSRSPIYNHRITFHSTGARRSYDPLKDWTATLKDLGVAPGYLTVSARATFKVYGGTLRPASSASKI